MFTGIVQAVGKVIRIEPRGGDVRLHVDGGSLDFADVSLGDSIATQGVCLTVAALNGRVFQADVSRESLRLTTLGRLGAGASVNLEKALTLNTRLGGHLVSGHIDGVGKIIERSGDARSIHFSVQAPDVLAKYIAHKGSICVDGVSLTVNGVSGARFELNVIPQTLQETTLAGYGPGQEVNLEVDLIARYLERLLLGEMASVPEQSGVSEALLRERGFIR